MKNILYFAFFFLLMSLYACNESDKIIIGISQCTGGEWREQMNREILSEAGFYKNVNIRIKNASGDIQQQIQDIRTFVNDKVDLLVISPLEDSTLIDSFNHIDFKNIPILIVDRKISTNKYVSFVGASNWEIGEKIAVYVREQRKGLPTHIIHIKGNDKSSATTERAAGFLNEIAHCDKISVSTIVSGEDSGGTRMDNTLSILNNSLEALEKADVIYAFNDAMALAAYNVLKAANVQPMPSIIGIDGLLGHNKGIDAVKDGALTATVVYPTAGRKIIDIAMKIIKGISVPKENQLSSTLIDKSNVQAYYKQGLEMQELQQKIDLLQQDKKYIYMQHRRLYICLAIALVVAVLIIVSIGWRFYMYVLRIKDERKIQELLEMDEDSQDGFKDEILAYIEQNYQDEHCDLSVLIDKLSLSRAKFYKDFKNCFNDTPNNYLKKYRLEKAKGLILLDKFTYAEVGYQVGFSSPAYFTKCFKEEYNITPSHFFELSKKKKKL